MFVFLTYLPVFLLKFRPGELVGCRRKFYIQWVPTWHTFDGLLYHKNKKYLKKRDDDIIIMLFQVFLVFGVARPIQSMWSGYALKEEFNYASNEYPLNILLIGSTTPKTRNTWKNMMMMSSSHFFMFFFVFGVAGSVKSMQCEYSLDAESNSVSDKLSRLKFE